MPGGHGPLRCPSAKAAIAAAHYSMPPGASGAPASAAWRDQGRAVQRPRAGRLRVPRCQARLDKARAQAIAAAAAGAHDASGTNTNDLTCLRAYQSRFLPFFQRLKNASCLQSLADALAETSARVQHEYPSPSTHTPTRARTRARTHARAHAHTYTPPLLQTRDRCRHRLCYGLARVSNMQHICNMQQASCSS